jgi:hypothetical protein
MMDTGSFSGIVDGIYETAVFPERWLQTLERLN